jgi:hypothetical protein
MVIKNIQVKEESKIGFALEMLIALNKASQIE